MTGKPDEQYVGLARLLVDYRARTRASYTDLAALTGLSRSTIGFIINKKPPMTAEPETVAALSAGLGLPIEVVEDAAIISAGYRSKGDVRAGPDRADALAAQIRRLPKREQEIVAGFIISLTPSDGSALLNNGSH